MFDTDADAQQAPPKQAGRSEQFAFSDPELERIHQETHGAKGETFREKAAAITDEIYRRATREYEFLPRTAEFQPLRFALNNLAKQKGVQSGKTVESLRGVLVEMQKNPDAYNLFERKVLLDDLMEEAAQGHDLPNGWTEASAREQLGRLEEAMSAHPEVARTLELRKEVWDSLKDKYIAAMKAIGFNVEERFNREFYFRHQVLDHAQARSLTGTGSRLRTPTSRGFLKQREGGTYLMNTNYLEAEYEVMAQMRYDIEVAGVIKMVDSKFNIANQLKEKAKALSAERGETVDWRTLVPDGYTLWQPREGNVFYMTNSISERIAMQIADGTLQAAGLSADQVKQVLAVGGARTEFVVKTDIADTLDNMGKKITGHFTKAVRGAVGTWKEWQLISPTRFLKYNIRNLTGDAEAVWLGNPSAFKKVPQAMRELYACRYGKKSPTGRLAEAIDMGLVQSTQQFAELSGINELEVFADLYERGGENFLVRGFGAYWRGARMATDFRESILRYAAYLDFMEQLEANNGRPKSWGASDPDLVMALETNQQKAFMLSNQLLGAYDEVSVITQNLRQGLMPFFSFKEVNAKRYIQLMKNINLDAKATTELGKKVTVGLKRTPFLALKAGTFLARAGAVWAMLQAYNNWRFPDEEQDLPADIRRTPHIILGRDEDGKVEYFTRLGILDEFLEWFVDDGGKRAAADWLNGKTTAFEAARRLVTGVPGAMFNQLIQATGPIKTAIETGVGKSYYPNVAEPSTIRDKGLFLARSVGMGDVYSAVMGLPQRSWKDIMEGMILYKSDPGEAGYWDIRDQVREFQEKIGKAAYSGGSFSPRSNALYNLKLALRYEDKKAALKYLNEYRALGGDDAGLETSLRNMHPLHGLNSQEQGAFVLWYAKQVGKEEALRRLTQAQGFYDDILLGKKASQPKASQPKAEAK